MATTAVEDTAKFFNNLKCQQLTLHSYQLTVEIIRTSRLDCKMHRENALLAKNILDMLMHR